MNQNLSKGFIRCAVNNLQEIFDAPEDELIKFVDMYTKAFLEYSHYYDHVDFNDNISTLDTVEREHLYDIVGMHFCRTEWPEYRHGSDVYEKFIKTLRQHAKDIGWKLNSP